MAEFQAEPGDLTEIIRDGRRAFLKSQASYPLVALLLGAALLPWSPSLGTFAFGMAAAWSVSIYWGWRDLPAEYLWRYAWLQEPVSVRLEDEGIRLGSARGESYMRWDGGIAVRALASCYVLEDEGDQVAMLPKRYFDPQERQVLDRRSGMRPDQGNSPREDA